MADALVQPLHTLWAAFAGLIWPALAFTGIALAARGAAALKTARNAAGEVRTNLILFAFDVLCITPLIVLLLGAAGAFIQRHELQLVSPQDWDTLPTLLVGFIALFAGDFIAYWRHRLEHTALIWPSHAIHHSDTAMTWTTGLRFHPLNRFTTALIDTSALALLGLPLWALMANNLIRHYYGLFVHMDLPWTYGPLGRLFVSPSMHRWHHIRDADSAGANFATVFSVFDQAFGTYHAPGACNAPLGVREAIGKSAWAQLVWPFMALLRWRAASAPHQLPS